MTRYIKGFVRFLRHNKAVSALEYAILVGVIAVAISLALVTFSDNIETAMKTVGDKVKAANLEKGVVK